MAILTSGTSMLDLETRLWETVGGVDNPNLPTKISLEPNLPTKKISLALNLEKSRVGLLMYCKLADMLNTARVRHPLWIRPLLAHSRV